ncbi:exported hypothetical protein [Gammaproteobacteria bacterium]
MKQNILLLSLLGINACYANNPVKIANASLYENTHNGVSIVTIGEDLFRTNFSAPRKCGIPTLTMFDKKDGNPYENQDVQLTSKPAIGDHFPWTITNSIKNRGNTISPKFYKITFDSNLNDSDCLEKSGAISEIEMNPHVFSTNDETKKVTIKNNYPQEIEITKINNTDKNGLVIPPKLSEPIKIPAGKAYDFELQPGVCPEKNSDFLPENEDIQFHYKTTDSGTPIENTFTIKVGIACNEVLDQQIGDETEETDLTTDAREEMLEKNIKNAQKRHEEAVANAKKTKQWADIAQKEVLDAAVEAAVKKYEQKSEKNKQKAIDAAVKKTIKEEAASRKQEVNAKIKEYKEELRQKNLEKKAKKDRESKEDL